MPPVSTPGNESKISSKARPSITRAELEARSSRFWRNPKGSCCAVTVGHYIMQIRVGNVGIRPGYRKKQQDYPGLSVTASEQ